MNGKKILFICHCLYGGGAEQVLVSLANYISNRGHNVEIVARMYNGEYPIDSSIDVKYMNSKHHISFIWKTRKEIKKNNPDVVIAFEYFYNLCAILACIGLGKKLIVSERNNPAIVGAGAFKDVIRNFLYRFCDFLVCQTPDAMSYFPQYIRGHSLVIANPLRFNLPSKEVCSRRKEIVTFCRLRKQKNIPLMIDAFSLLCSDIQGYKMAIYGDGEEKDFIFNYIKEKGMEDKITLYPASLDVHIKVIDAALYINSSDYEGLSNSMLEAMAIGLPVICTDCPCGGARMIIDDGINGLLVPVGDCKALAKAMKALISDKQLAEKLSNEARKVRTELSMDVIGNKWLVLINT
ncbi:glycosyltransferase family 4 protein [Bacteroides intestinalis]|uniref:Glycosyltransferase, group 1 family protein n=1 Tax=Bacteroides intestinalis TaxID=329854 RepID=A0A139KYG4_9BACE|nr:glycosyltransferase family 4 protein [Bacteroides intestinalis]KXT44166.1 glycosyltransferase, group 1 family protein [Bacteroides intestinalis]